MSTATIGFAESMPERDDVEYHVEWLDSQQAFPSLSSTSTTDPHHLEDWQFLHRQEIIQAEHDIQENGQRLETSEMEDKWQQVDFFREKQFVDVVVDATDLPLKAPPNKPRRHQQKVELTEEQQRLLYWNMIDDMEQEETDYLYQLYYDRKMPSLNNPVKGGHKHTRRHLEALQRAHLRLEQGELWDNNKIQKYLEYMANINAMDNLGNNSSVPSTKHWGRPPAMDPRLLHGLVHVPLPRKADRTSSSSSGAGSSRSKSSRSFSMESDFCLQVKN
ncbi:uncharacterized protein BX664DRAFT_332710 [Halteromyces radiatus]|uniref:uncharacterized protein n=1 Tax=Halteromyces radiatus TaxID=101107 RepID=UPI00221ECB00|nr:uncharacterized protein BX664DRAFT_332710 [Halteromyces radiatus]KAI8089314.1 hypothetical protein BX664DRAFT_332710 [Halteromyces radiatus]